MSTLVINSKQALDHLMANISSMDVKQLKNVQIHFEGRMAFPKLKQAMAKKSDPNGRKSFGAVGVFPMGNLSPVNQIGMNAIHAITSRMKQSYEVLSIVPDKNFIKCYKNIQESPVQESGKPHPDFYQNSWWVNMSSGEDFKPKVYKKVAGTIQQVDNADSDAYPGQEVVFVITLYPIGIDPKKPDSKKGVSANLIAVLIKGGGERFTGGDSEVDVNTFGGFSGSLQDFSQGNTNHFSAGQSVSGNASNAQQDTNPFGAQASTQASGNQNPFGTGTNAQATASHSNQQTSNNPFGNNLV